MGENVYLILSDDPRRNVGIGWSVYHESNLLNWLKTLFRDYLANDPRLGVVTRAQNESTYIIRIGPDSARVAKLI